MTAPAAPSPLGFQPRPFAPARRGRAAPLPKRPKGRWFVGLLLVGALATGGWRLWSSVLRYGAYGTVTCRTVEVSSPWDGVVRFVHRRQGDRVRQGELLATVENLELRERGAAIDDELAVERARLEAEAARIRWEAAYGLDQNRGAMATYYEVQATLLKEEGRLEETSASLARVERPEAEGTVPAETVERLRISRQAQTETVAKLRESLAEIKQRADEAERLLRGGKDLNAALLEQSRERLKPSVARIAALQSERARLAERLGQGSIRAPVNGTVLRIRRQAGEACKAGEPVAALLDESSLQVVLYLPQEDTARYEPGALLEVQVDPYDHPLHCRLLGFGDQYEPAPESIRRHYADGQQLLPAYLEPLSDDERAMALRANGVVKLARTARTSTQVARR